MILTVTYDLHNPGRTYEPVISAIKTATSWAHPQGSLWFIDTTLSPKDWIEKLSKVADANDEFFIARLQENWWSKNMDDNVIKWLKNPVRSW